MSCPICYTDDGDMIVCWNDHCLCKTCYRECLKPRVRYDVISGVDKYHVNNKCPTCRVPMFDWFGLVIENMNNTMIQPVRHVVRPIIRQTIQELLNISRPIHTGYWTDLQANVLTDLQANVLQVQPVAQSVRRSVRCGICHNTGHNRRTCTTLA
jgi:hypothetical protein